MLGIAPTVGDGFSYTFLPGREYSDILMKHNPTTLVRSVIHLWDLSSSSEKTPICWQSTDGFQFYDKNGNQMAGDVVLEEMDEMLDGKFIPESDSISSMHLSRAPSLDPSFDPSLGQIDV
jgi:hypothetical protein